MKKQNADTVAELLRASGICTGLGVTCTITKCACGRNPHTSTGGEPCEACGYMADPHLNRYVRAEIIRQHAATMNTLTAGQKALSVRCNCDSYPHARECRRRKAITAAMRKS